MEKKITPTVKRAGRISFDTLIAGLVVHFTGDPKWLGLAPVLAAVGKFLRSVIGLKFIPF